MSESASSRQGVNGDEPVNQGRAAIYERLMEAQEQIAHARYAHGVSHEDVLAALDAADEGLSDAERREDLFLSALAHYTEVLGGHTEVRAVFGDQVVTVRREPAASE